MENQQNQPSENTDLVRGLPMFTASDPQALAEEKATLAKLESKGFSGRWGGYFKMTGPGWIQSAIALGAGSAVASLFAGAYLQYELLWVQPLGMIVGVVMMMVISHQTLSTGVRPFDAMKRFIHPAMAWAWVIASLAATVIWHFPQYALAAGMADNMIKAATKWEPSPTGQMALLIGLGVLFLVISTIITWGYSSGRKGVRIYERILKSMVWMVIIAFAVVVVRQAFAGAIEWGKLFKGFLPLKIPTSSREVSVMVAAFGAALGINMTFLFPYTLLARGWGKEHRGLSRFDLITGMLLPFCVATALVVIAAGCTIYDPVKFAAGSTMLHPTQAAAMLEKAGLSMFFSRVVFGLGIIGMALSTITIHMLICGFAACEIFGVEPGGWRYRLACLLPAPAVTGVILWKYMGPWIGIPASAICLIMLPIAYVGFFLLNNSSKYLGENKPSGTRRLLWNIAMLIAIITSVASAGYYIYSKI